MQADIRNQMQEVFESVYDSYQYILGNHLRSFEQKYAAYIGTKYCAGVASGLDSMIIALKTLRVGPDDEVIVPSNTYIATWLAVSFTGARPVPVEPRPSTYNINPDLIRNAISKKTRAILPVHLYGQVSEMGEILSIARERNLFIVEDNAQGVGAFFNGQRSGSFGDINATSFYPTKNLGALGDGGAITTNKEEWIEAARILRNYGSGRKYYNSMQGMNSRLDELQAAFLNLKLEYLESWNKERNRIAEQYNSSLQQTGDLILPFIARNCTSNFHIYLIRTKRRADLMQHLADRGIETLIHYPVPPHLQEAYKDLKYKKGDFPIAEEIADTCLSLPIYPGLSEENVSYICETIKGFRF